MRKLSNVIIVAAIVVMCAAGIIMWKHSHNQNENVENEEKVVVTFKTWNPTDMGEYSPIHRIIEDFEAIYPYIDIQYEYIDSRNYVNHVRVELMGGEGADIYGMNTGMYYKEFREYEEEISTYCEQSWGEDWEEHFVGISMEQLKEGEKIYGIPLGITYAGSAWADVRMLEEYGLEIPDNYSKLKSVATALRANGQFPLAIGAGDSWINIDTWTSIAADINAEKLYAALNGEISFTEQELVESFSLWQNCFRDGRLQDDAYSMTLYNDVNDLFQREGRIPLMLNGSWALNMFTLSDEQTRNVFDSVGANHQVYAIDWNEDGEYNSIIASTDVTLCLNATSKVKDEAFLFMKYLVDEGQKMLVNEYMEYMPSVTDMNLDIEGLSKNGKECLDAVLKFSKQTAGMRGVEDGVYQLAITEALDKLAHLEFEPLEAAEFIEEVVKDYENGQK